MEMPTGATMEGTLTPGIEEPVVVNYHYLLYLSFHTCLCISSAVLSAYIIPLYSHIATHLGSQ